MVDLKFSYISADGTRITKQFDTIMDFPEGIESGDIPSDMLEGTNVDAEFFENPLLNKQFNKVEDLYFHCIHIISGH